ncbi:MULTISPECIES: hypothetical protein [Cohaesibacter]|nr:MULTISPECIES: hypothetical protein [Cohaesibacter]
MAEAVKMLPKMANFMAHCHFNFVFLHMQFAIGRENARAKRTVIGANTKH